MTIEPAVAKQEELKKHITQDWKLAHQIWFNTNSIKADKTQEAWKSLSLLNSRVEYGSSRMTPQYMKDSLGFVRVKASIKSGSMNAACCNLPAGYRPSEVLAFSVSSYDGSNWIYGSVEVYSGGNIIPRAGSNYLLEFYISFKAA